MRKQRQEQVDMHLEENRKVIFDTQNSKDKIEKLKVELYDLKKKLRKNEKFYGLFEDLKTKEIERQ